VDAAAPHLLVVDRQWHYEEGDVILGNRKVMQHADIGNLDLGTPDLSSLLVDLKHGDHVAAEASSLVAECHEVAGL